ncbi:FAD/NAD(P)-binding domain-containing protein [Teratosphaeria nubilosa]|uniref:FAD/NAD(P)-binding domain-containing protein n=1 Tax=Teratosphaeria nubilosa TaxID=161662 RepID=A0A6G1L021_9PEZI|nr:FAD/NAD(P)-binding domain-containing protein [Teratosphaeria nubilosa]
MASLQTDGIEAPASNDKADIPNGTVIIEAAVNEAGDVTAEDANAGAAKEDWVYPHPTDFKLSEHPVDEIRPLRVAVIGAGLSGVTAGALLPIKVPGIQLTIIEKNSDVGGTWHENRYPGVRCDIPAHVYQSTFSPNTQWSEEYAQGAEIRAYWEGVAKKYHVYSKTRFRTKVLGAYWEPASAKWRLELSNVEDGRRETERFDFLITAIGHFNEWSLPKYPGIERFQGHLRHSSDWDPSFDPTGKRIATIGNGASGIQVTTAIRKVAAHVDHYARSRTWIAGAFNPNAPERQDVPMPFGQEQLEEFKDPVKYLAYRKKVEDVFWRNFDAQIADSESSKQSTEKFKQLMKTCLTDDPSLLDKLVPDFPPHCRRLTPGPGYLEALTKPNLTFIQTPISHFTSTGIVDANGIERQVDAVICSTGANPSFAPPFPIVAGECDLRRDWAPDGKFGFPYSYLGVATPGFPNLAYILGPNPAGPSGTVPHAVETQIAYIAKMLRKISSQDILTMAPKKEATDDFVAYCDAFFPRTNLARKCSSWSNGGVAGARIHGHWPGSAAHLTIVRREPRWEDWEYEVPGGTGANRFAWLGDGWTRREREAGWDAVGYLRREGEIDLRDLHERWWDV